MKATVAGAVLLLQITIEQVLAHRAGLCDGFPPLRTSLHLIWLWYRQQEQRFFKDGCKFIEELTPQWTPGTHARYHMVCSSRKGCIHW